MRTSRRHDVLAATGAALTLLAIVVGVPIALAALVGWPLPRVLPSLDAILAALRYGQVPASTVLRALAVVLWVTWALAVVSIGAEIIAVARGTVARGLPGLPGLQHVATRLVATVLLLLPMTGRAAAAAIPTAPPAVAAVDRDGIGHHTEGDTSRPAAEPVWTVAARESLWSIADQALGDGRRWREIAQRNVDRPQPDGGRLRAGDTLIRPGWRLLLPPDAPARPSPSLITVRGGDDLWELAERHLGDGDRWRDLYAENRGRRQPDGRRLTDPDLIRPGWKLQLPSDASAEGNVTDRPQARGETAADRPGGTDPTGRRSPGRPTLDQPPSDGGSRDQTPRDQTPRDQAPRDQGRTDRDRPAAAPVAALPATPATLPRRSEVPTSVSRPERTPPSAAPLRGQTPAGTDDLLAIVGGAVLATGLIGLVARRRRWWLRRRPTAGAPTPIDTEAAELERWLRSMADHDLAQRVDRVARLLTDLAAHAGGRLVVDVVELGERTVLHLPTAAPTPPHGVVADDNGHRWALSPELEVREPAATRRHLAALVSCGRTPEGALVLASLFDGPAVGLAGATDEVAEVLTSWTAELASTGADTGVEIVVVGAHHPLIERLARVSVVADVASALDRIDRVLDQTADADRPSRIVVLCGTLDSAADRDALIARADDHRVAAVLPTATSAPRRVELDGAAVRLPDSSWLVAPRWLTPDDWDRFGDLLRHPAHAATPELVPSPLVTPAVSVDDMPDDLDEMSVDLDDDPAERMVGLLGPLVVDGRAIALGPDAVALLTWLAVHRTGDDPPAIAATLWPTAPADSARLTDACAELSAALGEPGEPGDTPIIRTDDGRLELTDRIGTDLARFDALLRRSAHLPPAAQARRMSDALMLVRGEPFADGADWAHADGLAVRTAAQVADVAHRLAMGALATLDVERAAWAVDQGLRAVPGCELLYRDRMRIADAIGDAAAIERAMDELGDHLDGAWPAPETTRLLEQLRGRSGAGATDLDGLSDAM